MLGRSVFDGVEYVFEQDPAISSGYEAYKKNFDRSKLKLKRGKHPTVFRLRQLTHRERIEAAQMNVKAQQVDYCVRRALVGVSDWLIGSTPYSGDAERDELGNATDGWLDKLRMPTHILVELWAAIDQISEAGAPL